MNKRTWRMVWWGTYPVLRDCYTFSEFKTLELKIPIFFSEDIDTEEPPAGWDIAQESRSHFTELLMAGNQDLVRATR